MTVETIVEILRKVLDVALVWCLLYYILRSLRKNVKMIMLFKGILIIVFTKILSDVLDLVTIGYLIDYVIEWAPLALIVIFQPEIRDALENLGRTQLLGKHKTLSINELEKTIYEITSAVDYMCRMRIGALIVIERDNSLAEYSNKAQKIYADVSGPLLSSIFYTNNPLHDGGVIIRGDKIICAGAVFPTSDSLTISKRLGTRHRAALGISEQTDCISLVVSEETGRISIAIGGELMYNLSLDEVRIRLLEALAPSHKILNEAKEKMGNE
ncbi:MAG TPA: TIGR00159 family protein [Candidatus Coprosoma intestinipullorum]|uniref:Diadenylate cyclase n=1 Tax=Candidatus Coprosoma intestinipullorum TaxID=2840752 RepID=A0A9D0ZPZ2_9FIRM|nr:TIGR00159 family protein [Candidatus Coprosoma intestinipullorum]